VNQKKLAALKITSNENWTINFFSTLKSWLRPKIKVKTHIEPLVEIVTDEQELRVGKIRMPKNPSKRSKKRDDLATLYP